jgi:DNA polymerase III subunit epsilon
MSRLPTLTVFDIETTGLDPKRGHRIIEIAGVRVEHGVPTQQVFASLVNPEREIPLEAKQVHHIGDDDVREAPTIDIVLPKFLAFAQDSLLVAHNASFDYGFLLNEKELCWGYVDLPECLCTMRMSQSLYPKEFRHNLDMLVKRFGLEMPTARHRALDDAMATAKALERMVNERHIASIDELRKHAGLGQMSTK